MMLKLKFPHPSWIEIDLAQLKRNMACIRAHVGRSLFCLPVKSNAYGHGLCAVGRAAEETGVDCLAVAHLQEGIQLREAGVHLPIMVLGAIHEDQILDLIHFDFEFSISSKFKADLVAEKCRQTRQKCCVHLEVDTGMQRTGVRPVTALELYQHLNQLQCFEVRGIYSHLATADRPGDPFTLQQIAAFVALTSHPVFEGSRLIRHIANSGGTLYYPQSHLEMVRPSLATFGYLPNTTPAGLDAIAPCFSLKTKISYFKVVEAGSGIGYGHTHRTTKQTRIVTIPVGYGDGYRRASSNRGSVLIRGKRFPIVGTICMDQCMVDLGHSEAYVGEEVVLIGKQGDQEITLHEIAHLWDTIPYEVLCAFNDRLPRIYV